MLSNRKPEHRRGKVQLIDATQWFRPLRKNMGKKNCELTSEDIQRICDAFLAFEETPQSKIFPNAAFGYWKVKVERPLRLRSQLARQRIETLRFASGDEEIRAALYEQLGDDLFEKLIAVREELAKLVNDWGQDAASDDDENGEGGGKKGLPEKTKKKLLDPDTWKRDAALIETAEQLHPALGDSLFEDYNVFLEKVYTALEKLGLKISAADLKLIVNAVSWRDEAAPPVVKKVHKPGKTRPDPLRGLFSLAPSDGERVGVGGKQEAIVEYEPDSELRDFEQIPLLEEGGIEAFIRREVLPYSPDAWIVEADTKIGYEVSFTRHFTSLRSFAPSLRSAPTSSSWNKRPKACSARSLREPRREEENGGEDACPQGGAGSRRQTRRFGGLTGEPSLRYSRGPAAGITGCGCHPSPHVLAGGAASR